MEDTDLSMILFRDDDLISFNNYPSENTYELPYEIIYITEYDENGASYIKIDFVKRF